MQKMGICKRVKWLAIHQPLTLPSIINDPYLDKNITIGILHDLIPRRTSIEIECIGSVAKSMGFHTKDMKYIRNNENSRVKTFTYPNLAKQYGVLSFEIDDIDQFDLDYEEHKISIRNYTQIGGLYKVLKDMNDHCTLNTKSGCHIHIDLSKTIKLPNFTITALEDFFTIKCEDGTIDNLFGKYETNHYKRRCIGTNDAIRDRYAKDNWIAYREQYKSLEFRTPPMTFDYSTIIKWFIGVNKLLNQFEYSLKYRERPKESPKVLEDRGEVDENVELVIEETLPSSASSAASTQITWRGYTYTLQV